MRTEIDVRAPLPEVRDLRFLHGSAEAARVPRHWHGGRRAVTLFFDNLSVFFPPGERFFIAAVRAHAGAVTDEALAAQVRAFCDQEGLHRREHAAYNEMLIAQGYPVGVLQQRVENRLRRAAKVLSRERQLAITCALEHFTALMGHVLLSEPRLLEGAHPTMAALWRWHAAEENEHKAVAFDVYRAARGRYRVRVGAMMVATVSFWGHVFEHQVRLMWADGCLFSLREWLSLFRFLLARRGGLRGLARHYFAYYRRSFHPWRFDNRGLVEEWKAAKLP